jgi:hypothetical protein
MGVQDAPEWVIRASNDAIVSEALVLLGPDGNTQSSIDMLSRYVYSTEPKIEARREGLRVILRSTRKSIQSEARKRIAGLINSRRA